ncbi:MAG: rhodanese-like domain-containing protein [Fibrobacteres bacterium]|nr:rhodanese-like domain-containing protein [Fibrobacterota bacterium]
MSRLLLLLMLSTAALFSVYAGAPIIDPEKRDITLTEAAHFYKEGCLFVDARASEDFADGHIRKAYSLSVNDFEKRINDFRKAYSDTINMIVYCSGRECSDSHDLAEKLYRSGYFNIRLFVDGFPAWKAAGFPVDTASN